MKNRRRECRREPLQVFLNAVEAVEVGYGLAGHPERKTFHLFSGEGFGGHYVVFEDLHLAARL